MQTPAAIVPAYPPDPAPHPDYCCATRQFLADESSRSNQGDQAVTLSHEPGARWQQKYTSSLWFQFTPAQLAAWYNERHPIEELLPPERNGMGLAGWRGERTASVGYTRDGQGWIDFGASARRSDGKQDGGGWHSLRNALSLSLRETRVSVAETHKR